MVEFLFVEGTRAHGLGGLIVLDLLLRSIFGNPQDCISLTQMRLSISKKLLTW